MTDEVVCIGVDVAEIATDVAISDSKQEWLFANDDEVITWAASCISGRNCRSPH